MAVDRRTAGSLLLFICAIVLPAGLPATAFGGAAYVNVDRAGRVDSSFGAFFPGVSADGRYVAFASDGPDLVAGDTNRTGGDPGWDVFVRDRETCTTTRVSVSADGAQVSGVNIGPQLSGDGRVVSFFSRAPGLVPGDAVASADLFVRDTVVGTTEIVNVDSNGNQPIPAHGSPVPRSPGFLSYSGRFVAFDSTSPDLDPTVTTVPGTFHVFVRDRMARTTRLVDRDQAGAPARTAYVVGISGDGGSVAFVADSWLFPGQDVPTHEGLFLYVANLTTGSLQLANRTDDGTLLPPDDGYGGTLSADGCVVAFTTLRFARDEVYPAGVAIWDCTSGAARRLTGPEGFARRLGLSPDGRFIGYGVSDDGGGANVVLRDLESGNAELLSTEPAGDALGSLQLAVSLRGEVVASTHLFAAGSRQPTIAVFGRSAVPTSCERQAACATLAHPVDAVRCALTIDRSACRTGAPSFVGRRLVRIGQALDRSASSPTATALRHRMATVRRLLAGLSTTVRRGMDRGTIAPPCAQAVVDAMHRARALAIGVRHLNAR